MAAIPYIPESYIFSLSIKWVMLHLTTFYSSCRVGPSKEELGSRIVLDSLDVRSVRLYCILDASR